MEGTLAPVYDCFDNIEMYYAERAMLEAKLVKEVDEMSVPEPLKSSKENVDKLLSHDNSKNDAPVVQTSVVRISSPVHQPIETETSPVMQLLITTVENKVHNTTSTSNLTTVPATSCTTPKVPLTHPRTVTTVTDSISTPVACYKLPSNPDQISTPAKQHSPCRGWTVPYQALSNPEQIGTPATQNYEEPAKCPPPNRRKPPKQDPPMNSSTLHIKGDPQPKGEEPTNKEPKSPTLQM